eukprot:TRINITY_DN5709_c0_g1_i1.p1 TRINITY_DN5709_c0_g1~~TRINITY_DN5709_c0_g1_i1.p1  ORF type:complete len:401 (+),score=59.81 TRINITY_DN5709_c0_g1_i1:107-1309(+)
MPSIKFATGPLTLPLHKQKICEVRKLLAEWNHDFEVLEVPSLSEIKGEHLEERATRKLKETYSFIQNINPFTCLVADCFTILLDNADELTETVIDQLDVVEFSNKYEGLEGTARVVVAYSFDGTTINLLSGESRGTIIKQRSIGNQTDFDSIWIPAGYDKTLSEMAYYKFIVNIRTDPYIKLAEICRNHRYQGVFEVHITVMTKISPSFEDEKRNFKDVCHKNNCRAILIELPTGDEKFQMMTSSYHRGELCEVKPYAFQLAQRFVKEGFPVSRLKIEAIMSNTGVPLTNEEASTLSKENYFEFHYKLSLRKERDIESLRKICQKEGAHLSRNALKTLENGIEERFVTQRFYSIGKEVAEKRFDSCRDSLIRSGLELLQTMKEYAVYDSNVYLDSGWIDI